MDISEPSIQNQEDAAFKPPIHTEVDTSVDKKILLILSLVFKNSSVGYAKYHE